MYDPHDYMVPGNGLTECVVSGLRAVSGKIGLHMVWNKHYGGQPASLAPFEDLLTKFGVFALDIFYGKSKDWNVDFILKCLMASGQLVKLLVNTGITRYLEFKSVDGSYVSSTPDNIFKVLAYEIKAFSADLVGCLEKNRFNNFMVFVQEFSDNDPTTRIDVCILNTMREVSNSASFIVDWLGHCQPNWFMASILTKMISLGNVHVPQFQTDVRVYSRGVMATLVGANSRHQLKLTCGASAGGNRRPNPGDKDNIFNICFPANHTVIGAGHIDVERINLLQSFCCLDVERINLLQSFCCSHVERVCLSQSSFWSNDGS